MSELQSPTSTSGIDASAMRRAQWINLVFPGGGMILAGDIAGGLTIGLVFAAAASLAVAGSLIVPDDFSPAARNLTIIAAALAYIVAQFLLAQRLRSRRRHGAQELRRTQLGDAVRMFQAGDVEGAWAALQPLATFLESDLLVALRWAQVLDQRGDAHGAAAAWVRVKRLDRHHIYRREVHDAERRTQPSVAAPGASPSPASRDG